jgi:RNA polymerase sigma-70 factor (ECF subfamily)
MAGELDGAVTRLIRALPSRLRDPLLLAATGQYTYEELAIILGVPSGTLKWRTSEARRVLKQKLEKLGLLP